jgi:Leucine-rich repeat (LRR) protein
MAINGQSHRRFVCDSLDLLLIGVLSIETFLAVTQWLRCFWFNERKGWAVLMAVTVAAATMILTVLWFAYSLVRRRKVACNIRSSLLLAVIILGPISWLALAIWESREQRRAVEAIGKLDLGDGQGGGTVGDRLYYSRFDYEDDGSANPRPPAPGWMTELLGADFFADVIGIRTFNPNGRQHIKQLKQLQDLRLWPDAMDSDLECLEGLTRLRCLSLDGTKITDLGLERLKAFPKLKALSVSNMVTDGGIQRLQRLAGLRSLECDGAPITDDGVRSIGALHNIWRLNLSRTRVTDFGLRFLKALPHLRSLDLSGTGVTDAGLRHIESISNLSSLGLANTQITDAGLQRVGVLTSLQRLDLSDTRITDAGLACLVEMPNITVLWLNGTQITDAGLQQLSRMKNLEFLMLRKTAVTNLGLPHLKGLLKLRSIDLADTRARSCGPLRCDVPNLGICAPWHNYIESEPTLLEPISLSILDDH